ncbi:hypothetical protein H310_06371 [Aphanomyces invadans]|uniref:Chromatin target of PRMT1 protein C-terminal domain-containing protein n=1 Tax=Aphanomyces invadans TaxID=157072 RepID=A0A024U7D2_9STRA|nr:hypothetical protein H310_06371 [Aphanomyces invadans]ETW01792.1 hypothetical protein H310_06371 [Aphanomyces invadans]|eukprot:XP_008869640.1 hypothetical protein H310_06371 [Aphanomyces invadans]
MTGHGRGRGRSYEGRGGRTGGRDGHKHEHAEANKERNIIGFLSKPLSERFAALHASALPVKKNVTQQSATRVQAVQKAKRQTNVNTRRGLSAPPPPVAHKPATAKHETKKLARTPQNIRGISSNRGRGGRGRGGRGGYGGRGNHGIRGNDQNAPSTKPEDLDFDMDTYWHQGGKGPDPKQAELDRQMEAYWAAKPEREIPDWSS